MSTPNEYPSLNFGLGETADQIRQTVRSFSANEVAPIAAEIDEEHRFPKDVWDKIVELGLPGIPFPEELGGSNGGTLAYALAVEEVAKVCGSTALTLAAQLGLLAGALVPEPQLRVLRLVRYYALATASIALGTLDRFRHGPPAAWEKSEGTR